MTERGKYIVFEGADGTGKSEQAIRITKRLQAIGRHTLIVLNDETGILEPIQEPGGVPIANDLRHIIKDKELERDPWLNVILFTAARRADWLQAMKPALDNGIDVVTSRNWRSTDAYQGGGQGISSEAIRQRTLADVGAEYMRPDLEVILAVEDEMARKALIAQRGPLEKLDTFESLPDTFQSAMQNRYLKMGRDDNIEIIPVHPTLSSDPDKVEKSIEVVTNELWKRVQAIL